MITKRHHLYMLAGFGLTGLVPHLAFANGGEKKKTGGETYTQMPVITLATRQTGRKRGTLTIEFGLFSDNQKIIDRIKLMMPRLVDGYITTLQPYALTLTPSALVNTDFLSTQLQGVTDKVLGLKGAKILLGSIVLN